MNTNRGTGAGKTSDDRHTAAQERADHTPPWGRRAGDGDDLGWIDDEWWRDRNPHLSAFRGMCYGVALSAVLWLLILAAVWLLVAYF